MIVCKFGGTSCCSAEQLKKVKDILLSNSERKYAVLSAPGKRFSGDRKVTDLLYALEQQRDSEEILNQIQERYQNIVDGLGVSFDLDAEFNEIKDHLSSCTKSWLASRGEYLNAKIFAAYIGWPFLEAADAIFFDGNHQLMESLTYRFLKKAMLSEENCVIPGFYGSDEAGNIEVFPRGGSDITGAVAARAVGATVYENWTDVDGILTADPRLVPDASPIPVLSYRELRELSYMGASMLQEEAVFPCRSAGIPINLRNTNHPAVPGTWIVPEKDRSLSLSMTGIAGKKGFSNIQIEKAMMNTQIGFGAKALQILADHGVSFEHNPTSIDTMSILVPTADLSGCREALLKDLEEQLHPDRLFAEDGIALIAVVGEGIVRHIGFAAELFSIIADAGINVRMIDVGFSEVNLIIGVNEADFEKTVRAIHDGLTHSGQESVAK